MNVHRVVIGDHNPLCRRELASLLASGLDVGEVVQASDFPHLQAAIARTSRTTMAAINMKLPLMEGVAGLRKLRAVHPSLFLVVVGESRDGQVVLTTLKAGVHGYIPSATPPDELIRAFETVLAGHIYVPMLIRDRSVDACAIALNQPASKAALTRQQLEVLKHLAAGQSNKEIARSLFISEGTVKTHLIAVFRALGVHNRVGAAAALPTLIA